MVPEGYDVRNPVETGPFKYESFTAGTTSTFVRNDNYWQQGLPYLDSVTITDFADETSQLNALLSHETDIVNLLSAASVESVTNAGGGILDSPGEAGSRSRCA